MLNDFLNTVGGGLIDKISGNVDVGSANLDGVSDVVTDTFKDGIFEKLSRGDIGDIMSLLGSEGSSTPFAGLLTNNLVRNLISKLGLPKELSDTIANVAIPFLIEKFGGFVKDHGKDNEDGIKDLLGDVLEGSLKDKLIGALGKKFGF